MELHPHLSTKLTNAVDVIVNGDGPMPKRLHSVYVYDFSGLREDEFPDADGYAQYLAICEEFNRTGEAMEGEGSAPTTLWLMSDEDADALAEQVVELARRYGLA